jgi:hypothetical protein
LKFLIKKKININIVNAKEYNCKRMGWERRGQEACSHRWERQGSFHNDHDEHNNDNNNKMKCLRQRKENKTSLFEIKRQYNREQMGKGTKGNKEHVPTVGAAVT